MTQAVIIDKCFLQGAPASHVAALEKSHRLLMSDGLFYELLTGSEPGRSRCFAKLPVKDNPVEFVNHIGTLMRKEIDTHQPAGMPSQNKENIRFQFHPKLRTGNYEMPPEAQEEVDRMFAELSDDVIAFIERAKNTTDFFPDLFEGSQSERDLARANAENAIVEPGSLLAFYSQLQAPLGEKPLPPAAIVDESWAIYRWLQVQFLFALDVCVRYQGAVPETLTSKTFEKLEHDVLDAQVLMLACLEGGFATREKKLQRWWRLLRPDGQLFE
jgi:hypothetical protein